MRRFGTVKHRKVTDLLEPASNSFGLIRLLLAMGVLVSHCFYLRHGTAEAEPFIRWAGYTLGDYAVQGFFIVSGLLVAQSLDRSRSLVDFGAARLLRIVPALAACIALTAFVLGPLVSSYDSARYFVDPALPHYVVRTLSLSTGSAPLPGVFENLPVPNIVNLSLWTLKYEVACYMALAIAAAVLLRLRASWSVAVFALAVLAFIFQDRPDLSPGNGFAQNLRYFALFFGTGVLAYVLRHEVSVRPWLLVPFAALFLSARNSVLTELITALCLGYALLCVASVRIPVLSRLATQHDLSYGVYICGVPISQTLLQVVPELPVGALILSTSAFSLLLAALSWRYIEKPALRWRKPLVALIARQCRAVDVPLS